MLGAIFEQFVEESPVSVMARGLMERVFAPERMDRLFEIHAVEQYQQQLLFSSLIDLMSLVVLDPLSKLVTDIFPCADGHAQERCLFNEVLATVQPNDVWNGDRNFGTAKFLFTIAQKNAFFVIRQHGALGWKPLTELQALGQTDTGTIFEQEVEICYEGSRLRVRRILLKLFQPTRDGEWEIAILTNLPQQDASAMTVAEVYRRRWSLETLFQTVTNNFNGEIQTLAYPKAALFSFSMALVAYNILATLRAALSSVHGMGKIEAGLSDFYVVDEIQATYRGMMIAIAPTHWEFFRTISLTQMALLLQHLAAKVHLKRFLKTPRGPKKKRDPLIVDRKHRHVSTARLLEAHQTTRKNM